MEDERKNGVGSGSTEAEAAKAVKDEGKRKKEKKTKRVRDEETEAEEQQQQPEPTEPALPQDDDASSSTTTAKTPRPSIDRRASKRQRRNQPQPPSKDELQEEDLAIPRLPDSIDIYKPLETETIHYLRSLSDMLDDTTQPMSEEDVHQLIDSLFNELRGLEHRVLAHNHGSRTLERIVPRTTPLQLRQLWSRMMPHFFSLCVDRSASHVIELMMIRMPKLLVDEHEQNTQAYRAPADATAATADADVPSMSQLLLDVCLSFSTHGVPLSYIQSSGTATARRMRSCWPALLCNENGTFFTRHAIATLCGRMDVSERAQHYAFRSGGREAAAQLHRGNAASSSSSSSSSSTSAAPVVDTRHVRMFNSALAKIINSVAILPNQELMELAFHSTACPALQYVLDALSLRTSRAAVLENLIARLLLWTESESSEWGSSQESKDHIRGMLLDRVASHLIDVIVRVGNDTVLRQFYVSHLKGQLQTLAHHASGNFCVQRFLTSVRDAATLSECVAELTPIFRDLLTQSREGIVWRTVEACSRVGGATMSPCLAALVTAVDARPDGSNLIEKLLSLRASTPNARVPHGVRARYTKAGPSSSSSSADQSATSSTSTPAPSGVSYFGCLIAQALLRASSPDALVVNSVLQLGALRIRELSTHASGSHLIDAFLTSAAHATSKHTVVDMFKGFAVALATNTYGSFVIERAFLCADVPRKETIARELVRGEHKVQGMRGGHSLWQKLRLAQFKVQPKTWLQFASSAAASLASLHAAKALFADLLGTSSSSNSSSNDQKAAAAAAAASGSKKDEKPSKRAKSSA